MRRIVVGVLCLVVAFGAVACGDDDSGGGASGGGDGVYVWEGETGAVVRYTIPAPADHELIRPIERFKDRSGDGGDVSFVLAELNNTDGSEQVQIPSLEVVTSDGGTVVYESAWLLVGNWQDSVGIDDTGTYNFGVDVYNKLLDLDGALPGAKVTTVLAASAAPVTAERVFVSPGLTDPVELSKD